MQRGRTLNQAEGVVVRQATNMAQGALDMIGATPPPARPHR